MLFPAAISTGTWLEHWAVHLRVHGLVTRLETGIYAHCHAPLDQGGAGPLWYGAGLPFVGYPDAARLGDCS